MRVQLDRLDNMRDAARMGRIMEKMKKVIVSTFICLCFSAFFLGGCGQAVEVAPVTTPAIALSEEGAVTSYLVGDFDKDYYSVSELKEMIEVEVKEYNAGGGRLVLNSVERAENNQDKVVVAYLCEDIYAYKDYFGKDLFYGTVAEANAQGYDLDVRLKSLKKVDTVIGKTEILNSNDKHILIVEDSVRIICPQKVAYVSEDALINEDGTIMASEEGFTYILFK